jgi:hypothetical protein
MVERKCLKIVASWAFKIELKFIELKYKEFTMLDFVKLGTSRGYYCGYFFNELNIKKKQVTCEHDIVGTQALVIIQNEKDEGSHALYWNGEQLLNPEGGGYEEKLNSGIVNKLISWMPIIDITEKLGEYNEKGKI